MNHHLVARTLTRSAIDEIREHGIGRGGWLKDIITQARVELMRAPDMGMQADHAILELFAAAIAVGDSDVNKALQALDLASEDLTTLIEKEEVVPFD